MALPCHVYDAHADTNASGGESPAVFTGTRAEAEEHCDRLNEVNFNQRGPFGGGRYYATEE